MATWANSLTSQTGYLLGPCAVADPGERSCDHLYETPVNQCPPLGYSHLDTELWIFVMQNCECLPLRWQRGL